MRTYSEPLVARVTGINKRVVSTHRRQVCAKRVDWQVLGGVVHYTEAGLKKICAALGLDAAALAWPAEDAPAAPGDGVAAIASPQTAAVEGPKAGQPGLLQKIASAVGLGQPAAEAPLPAAAAPGAFARRDPAAVVAAGVARAQREAPEPVLVKITKISPNPTIVIGTAEGIDGPVSVRVRSNQNFIPGLFVKATPVNGHRFFTQVGRPPRWRGDRVGFTAETSDRK